MRQRAFWMAVAVLLLLALLVPTARSQQLTVGGIVRAAFHVDIVAANVSAPCLRWERRSPAALRLWLTRGAGCPDSIEIDAALRTNAHEYEFAVTEASANTVARVQFGSPRPNGPEVHLMAASLFRAAQNPLCAAERCMATGTRISMRGSFSSPSNALIVPITLTLDGSPAPVTLDLLLGAK